MKNPLTLIALIILAGLVYNTTPYLRHVYNRYHRRRVVTCPETQGLAEVQIRAGWAAATAILAKPALRVKSCTLWPGKKGCTQGCIEDNCAEA